MRAEIISRMLRRLHYYEVPEAGLQIDLKRSKSYEAAKAGLIPTVRIGKYLLVPRKVWDAKVKRWRRGPRAKSRRSHKPAPTEANAT